MLAGEDFNEISRAPVVSRADARPLAGISLHLFLKLPRLSPGCRPRPED